MSRSSPPAAAARAHGPPSSRPRAAAIVLTDIVVLAVTHYATLLGVPPGDPAAWVLPASYAAVAVLGIGWDWS